MGRYVRGGIDLTLDLGTLASKTAVLVGADAVNERTLVSSIVCAYSVGDLTQAAGDGPILVGLAHGDYSLVEINEYLEQTTSWDEGDKASQEISKRQIRRVGLLAGPESTAGFISVLNDGKPVKTKLNWIINQGQSISFWAYNAGDSALATTDPDVKFIGHANLWPK